MVDPAPPGRAGFRQVARILVLVGGLGIAAVGSGLGVVGLLVGFLEAGSDVRLVGTLSLSLLVLTAGLGLALAWQGWQASRGRASRPFQPRRVGLWIALFVLAVFVGQLALSLGPLALLTFPPFHVAATLLPCLAILAAVGRSLSGATRWREMVLQLSSGAFVSTFLAFSLELFIIVGLITVTLLWIAMRPDGLEAIQAFAGRLQDETWLQEPANLGSLLMSPGVALLAAVVFVGVIPLVEEAIKTVGVPLLAYRRPSMAQAFLWGLAGGTGFALAEGLFNTLGGLDAWALVISMRVGATLLHCLTGGLMGLAWYYLLREDRWLRALGLYALSVGLHSLWNGLAGLASAVSLAGLGFEGGSGSLGLAALGLLAVAGLLLVLALAVGAGLAVATRFVRRRSFSRGDVPPAPDAWRG